MLQCVVRCLYATSTIWETEILRHDLASHGASALYSGTNQVRQHVDLAGAGEIDARLGEEEESNFEQQAEATLSG